jgi:integrase
MVAFHNWNSDRIRITPIGDKYKVHGTTPDGERHRFVVNTKPDAIVVKRKIVNGAGEIQERPTALGVDEEAEIHKAIAVLERAKNLPEGFTLLDAADYAVKNYSEKPFTETEWEDALKAFRRNRLEAGKSERSIDNVKSVVTRLFTILKLVTVDLITSDHIKSFISTAGEAKGPWAGQNTNKTRTTRSNGFKDLRAFFNFCEREKILESNPFDGSVTSPGTNKRKIGTLSLDEVRELLEVCQGFDAEHTVPYFALSLFAGVRPEELINKDEHKPRLKWENFIWRDGDAKDKKGKKLYSTLEVDDEVGKVTTRRVIKLPEAAVAWIKPFAFVTDANGKVVEKKSGNIISLSFPEWRAKSEYVRAKAGYKVKGKFKSFDPELHKVSNDDDRKKWIQDGLRHTCLTYYLPTVDNNFHIASDWAGNSPAVYKRDYNARVKGADDLTPEQEVDEYWSILPA